MTIHGIVATPWQIGTASIDRLKWLILPLEPQPEFDGGLWHWRPEHMKGLKIWSDGALFDEGWSCCLKYQAGDEVYLQEEWCKGEWGEFFSDTIYFARSQVPAANVEQIWQPAKTMPLEAAQHRFFIEKVDVIRWGIPLATASILRQSFGWETGHSSPKLIERDYAKEWDALYPKFPANPNLHMIRLLLKKENLCQPKF